MKIGIIGLGLMGGSFSYGIKELFPDSEIFGFDISQQTIEDIKNRKIRYREEWVDKYLPKTKLDAPTAHPTSKARESALKLFSSMRDSTVLFVKPNASTGPFGQGSTSPFLP